MSNHATIIGGSNAKRRLNCLGSYHAEKKIPQEEPSRAAAEGTVCHSIMEKVLLGEIDHCTDCLGEVWMVDGHHVEITNALLADKVDPAIDAWDEIVVRHRPVDSVVVEPKVGYAEGAWGSTDVVWRDEDDWINVLDWKFGRMYVSEIDSYQLKFYAGAAIFGERVTNPAILQLRKGAISGVRLIVVQPLHDPIWRFEETDLNTVKMFGDLITRSISVMEAPDAPRTPGPWCGYCRAKATCDAFSQRFLAEVEKPVDWKNVSGADLAARKYIRDMAEEFVKAYDKYELAALMSGVAVPQRKLVRGHGRWAWKEGAEKTLLDRLDPDIVYEPRKMRSLSALKKELRGRRDVLDMLPELAEKKPGGLTAVDATDKRPAEEIGVAPSAQELGAGMDDLADW